MRKLRSVLVALCLWPPPCVAAVVIEHDAVGCVAAGKFPRFAARFDPADAVARARLHFRPEGWPHWYSVAMKKEGDQFLGVLPKPESKLARMSYYISVTDREFGESRTAEASPVVVSGPGGCQRDKVMALALKAARVVVSGPEGVLNAPLVPAGFSTDGVVAGAASGASGGTAATGAAGASGAAVAGGAAAGAAAAGGGISTAVLVVGGVAVAGGAAVVAAKGSGGGRNGGDGSGNGGQSSQVYHVNFTPNINVSVCAGRELQWCCQNVSADANGNFDTTWAPSQPNTARVTGRVDATTFTATLACVSGGASTTLSASGNGGTYRGSFSFNGSSGALTVTKGSP